MGYETDLKLFIDGVWKSGEGRDAHTVVNPADANPIAEVPHDDAAHWPRDEPDPERRERGEGRSDWRHLWKEPRPEHRCRGRAVDEEVVPLDRRADGTRRRNAAHVCGRRRRDRVTAGRETAHVDVLIKSEGMDGIGALL